MAKSNNANKAIGRAVIWGGVLILVGLALYEFRARSSYQQCYDKVVQAFDSADAAEVPLPESEVEKLVTGYSKKETENSLPANHVSATRLDKYSYRGLVPGSRDIYVYYGDAGDGNLGVVAVRANPLESESN